MNTGQLDAIKFLRATNPSQTLFTGNQFQDRQYYTDFSSVRGGQIIDDLKSTITGWGEPTDRPTCQLFTGHVGCGKSTELLLLKKRLELENNFHVVYVDSLQKDKAGDVDISDILLAIAQHVSKSLEDSDIYIQMGFFEGLFQQIKKLFNIRIENATLSAGIASITFTAKDSPDLHHQLKEFLEPKTGEIVEAINRELLQPAKEKLKREKDRQGLVIIVDNLEKMDSSPKPWGRPQPEYIFIDRAHQLRALDCHVVYTMPLALNYSMEYNNLKQQFPEYTIQVLPMVPVKLDDNHVCDEGMAKLREMVLARAFPYLDEKQRLQDCYIREVFDDLTTLDYLCQISGGHVRNLLRLLNRSIQKQKRVPIRRETLETFFLSEHYDSCKTLDNEAITLLRQVAAKKWVTGNKEYQRLIHNLFVFQYNYKKPWFDVNPFLIGPKGLNHD